MTEFERARTVGRDSWFFAVAPALAQVPAEILAEWERRHALAPDLHLYALVDRLLVPDIVELCSAHGSPAPLSVYAGQPGYDSGRDWSPCLLLLSVDPDGLTQQVRTLVSDCSGIPALGFVTSRHAIDVIKAQLLRLTGITDGQGKRWLLRFADTRVWPPAPGWLTAEQQAHAFAGIDAWMVVERHGDLQTLEGSPNATPAAPGDMAKDFRVTERQLIHLIDCGEADMHLSRMAENPYHAQLARTPIEQYDVVRQALATLDRLGIGEQQQRFVYARFAVRHAGDCEQDPAVQQALLAASRKEALLSDLLKALRRRIPLP
ncbi:DUF4123 domain-containing protein [Cupriavidus sp. NPDC089707]|uniref:DUF4123 domain-containing protein n=1 Tax=Cupriavidus sp. NPDC089707 TaxID=3363963 RepID=UPI0037F40324